MKVMLDLETMGNGSNAAIIAIGAVAFDENKIVDEFYIQINLSSAIDCGGIVDGSTVMWWINQKQDARSAFKDNGKAKELNDALYLFSSWCELIDVGEVWGNGAMFDNAILGNSYKNCGLVIPWKYWNDRCYRTVKSMHTSIKLERVGAHHNAVDDAKSQALHLIKILKSST